MKKNMPIMFKAGMLILLMLLMSVSVMADFRTLYNPFTQRLDFYRGNNMSDEKLVLGEAEVKDNFTVRGYAAITENLGTMDLDNATFTGVSVGTAYEMNCTDIVSSTFQVFAFNGSTSGGWSLLSEGNTTTGDTNYTLNHLQGSWNLDNSNYAGNNITIDAQKYYLQKNLTKGELYVEKNITMGSKITMLNGETIDNQNDGTIKVTGDLNTTGNIGLNQKIVFGLGELFDNIVNGWIRLTGSFNVTGDVDAIGSIRSRKNVTADDVVQAKRLLIIGNETSGRIDTPANNSIRIGDAGTQNRGLTANDDLYVSGKLEVDGTSWFDGFVEHYSNARWQDGLWLYLGNSGDAAFTYSDDQTPYSIYLGVGAESNNFLIGQIADESTNFAHPLQLNPTVFIQSADQTQIKEFGSLAFDNVSNSFQIQTGDGYIMLNGTNGTHIGNGSLTHGFVDANDLFVGGDVEIDGYTWFDNTVYFTAHSLYSDNSKSMYGSDSDAALEYNTAQTPDTLILGTSLDSNSFIIGRKGMSGVDMGHALQANPTVFIHSNDTTDTADWLSLVYLEASEEALFETGQGDIRLNPSGDLNFSDNDVNNVGVMTGNESRMDMNWTYLQNYPAACPSGYAVTQLDDAVTCTLISTNITGANMTGNLNMTGHNITSISELHAVNDRFKVSDEGSIYTGGILEAIGGIYNDVYHSYNADANITLLPNGAGIVHVGNAGITSHSLNANDDLFVGGKLETDGELYVDNSIYGSQSIILTAAGKLTSGSGGGFVPLSYYQSINGLSMLTNAPNIILIYENADQNIDFGHSAQSNPTLFIQGSDETDTSEWLSLAYDNSTESAVIATGAGDLKLNPFGVINASENNITNVDTITVGAGATGIPSISFDDDINTGIYNYGADQIGFSLGGTTYGILTGTYWYNPGVLIPYASGNSQTAKGRATDSATAIGVILDNENALSTDGAKSLSVRNAGAEKASIDYSGRANFTNGTLVNDGTLAVPSISFSGDEDTGFYRSGGGEISFTSDGARSLTFGPYQIQSNRFRPLTAAFNLITGAATDGATAIANKIGNANALTTAGAKILSLYSDDGNNEKAYFSYDGSLWLNGSTGNGANISTGEGMLRLVPDGKEVSLPTDVNVTWDNGAHIAINDTCMIMYSPDNSGSVEVCNA